jgi:hypothetical protein
MWFCPYFTSPVTAFIVQTDRIRHKLPMTLFWITARLPTTDLNLVL